MQTNFSTKIGCIKCNDVNSILNKLNTENYFRYCKCKEVFRLKYLFRPLKITRKHIKINVFSLQKR